MENNSRSFVALMKNVKSREKYFEMTFDMIFLIYSVPVKTRGYWNITQLLLQFSRPGSVIKGVIRDHERSLTCTTTFRKKQNTQKKLHTAIFKIFTNRKLNYKFVKYENLTCNFISKMKQKLRFAAACLLRQHASVCSMVVSPLRVDAFLNASSSCQ